MLESPAQESHSRRDGQVSAGAGGCAATAGATGRCLQALEAVLLQQARRAGVAGGWRRCSNSGRDGMFFNGDAMDVGSRVFTLR